MGISKIGNRLKKYFIKDYVDIKYMGNSDNNNNSKNKTGNPAAPDNRSEGNTASRIPESVIKVDGNGNIIEGQSVPEGLSAPSNSNLPNQPPGGNTNAIAGPGKNNNEDNLNKAAAEATGQDGQGVAGQQQEEDQGFDIEKAISESTKEIKSADDSQLQRVEKQKRLMAAVNSRRNMESVIFINNETQKEVGRKLRYLPDASGKTIYDYMNDPEVQEHIGFKVADSDPRDGSFIEKQISIYWINPVF